MKLSDKPVVTSVALTDQVVLVNSSDQVRLASFSETPISSAVNASIASSKASAQGYSVSRVNHLGQDAYLTLTKAGDYTVEAVYLQSPTILSVTNTATITIPTDANAPNVPVGSILLVLQTSASVVTIAAAGGVTLLSATTLTGAGKNSLLMLRKIGTNTWHVGYGVAGTSSGTTPAPVAKPTFTVPPTISYSATVSGSVLTCSTGTTDDAGATRTYQWGFIDTLTNPGTVYDQPVFPADTDNSYTTVLADVGSTMWCEVTATNNGGSTVARAVGPTITGAAAPPPPPPPTNVTRGTTLTSFTPMADITALSNSTYHGLSFSGSGVKVTVPNNVSDVLFEECQFVTSSNACALVQGVRVTFRHCTFLDSPRGILLNASSNVTIELCRFEGCSTGTQYEGHAIENDYNAGPAVIDSNHFIGTYNSDCISNFQASRVTLTNNTGTVNITEPSGAPFTIGDGTVPTNRGRDNYVAFNQITQTGVGVQPGVFGSDGNTIIEYNCFPQGIQAYAYPNENPGVFLGVVIRHNLINFGASYLPMPTSSYGGAEFSTNVNGTSCALTPTP